MQFTEDEVYVIRQMLSAWTEAVPAIERQVSLHDRIKQLPKEEKVRKTIVIDTSIGERFDAFCDAERLNNSDILHWH